MLRRISKYFGCLLKKQKSQFKIPFEDTHQIDRDNKVYICVKRIYVLIKTAALCPDSSICHCKFFNSIKMTHINHHIIREIVYHIIRFSRTILYSILSNLLTIMFP